MSKIQVNEIVNHFDNGAPDCPKGLTVTGFTTFSGGVSVGGTLTYEDVTNVESIGVATFRDDVNIGVGGTTAFFDVSTGRIGIGTDNPGTNLDVHGNIRLSAYQANIQLNDGGPRLRVPTDNTLTIHTGGNLGTSDFERLRITSDGDVGLGTASPRSITNFRSLAINGTSGAFTDYFLNGTRTGTTAVDSNGFTSEAVGSSTPFRVITNGTEKLRITSSGNIGIGLTNPNDTLEVLGSAIIGKSGAASQIRFRRPSEASITGFVGYTDSGNDAKFEFRGDGGSANVKLNANNATGYITFDINSGEKVRIDSTGNVGIGLTNPGDYVSEANQLVIAGTGQRGITISSTNSSNSNIYFADGTSGSAAYRGVVRYEHSSDSMQFWTAGSERMRIRSGGVTVTNGTTILFGNTSSASSPRSLAFGSNEIAWTAEGSGGTNLFLNACDSAGDNGSSYAMIFRGLASGGSVQATLSGVTFASSVFTASGVFNQTTVSGANVHVASGGTLYRSTSSAAYKKDIETIEDAYSDALLQCRPVWYRSTANGDDLHPNWGHWGFIAEEVAEIDPRLIFWKTHETITDIDGNTTTEELDEPIAEGVQYDRFVPHLLNLIKRQKEQIETLETTNASQAVTIAALDARLTALEGA